MTSLEFMDGHITEDEHLDFRNYLHQALQPFESLQSISFKDPRSPLYFKDILNIIASRDNIALVGLSIENLTWGCLKEIPKSWQRIFANLKTLHIEFGDEYHAYTPECVSGLTKVLEWASTVEELQCEAHWDLFWDDIAIGVISPSLKHLELKSCKITESFLRDFLNDHLDIEHLDMCVEILKEKEDKMPMKVQEAVRMFRSPLFNSIKGTISQEIYEKSWGGVELEISHEHVKYIPKTGREKIYPKEWL